MIKALRKKFMLVNMLLVFIVLAIVFGGMATSSYRYVVGENRRTLSMLLDEPGLPKTRSFQVGGPMPEHLGRPPVFMLEQRGGSLTLYVGEDVELTQEEALAIFSAALEAGEEGVLRQYGLRFALRQKGDRIWVACIQRQNEVVAARAAAVGGLVFLTIAMAAFFGISMFLSRWALRPVEKAWEQQRRFVADASHELKTPLTVILANTGILMENTDDTVGNQMKWVENTAQEATRMKGLVDGLLFLAKSDEARTPMVFSRLNLSDLVSGTALALEALAFEKGIRIDMEGISPEIGLEGDEAQLKQLTGILLENAVKYSEAGGQVTVGLEPRQSRAVLSVHNRGQALSEEQMKHVFDRFYRADPSRSEGGYGLGLAIAAQIAELHRGKITVESGEETGTVFRVFLPI